MPPESADLVGMETRGSVALLLPYVKILIYFAAERRGRLVAVADGG